uniref:Sortilin N-terminal domain-containing protein n=1 Tax=candidate division WOR-3 bacterium TaxID=2052148 RepID=A0A7C6A9A7_UNCW3
MKRKIVFLLVLFSSGIMLFADWVSIGPTGGQIYCGATSNDNPPIIYIAPATSPSPILKSTDRGETWTVLSTLYSYPYAMVIDPNNSSIIYAIISSLCYKSTNGGISWNQYTIRTNTYFQSLTINPLNSQVLFAGGYAWDGSYWRPCVARSTNGGVNWTVVNNDTASSSYNYSIAIDPVDTTIVYAGGYANGRSAFYKSTDRGETWTRYEFPTNVYYVYSLYVSPLNHQVVLAGATSGVMRSTDGGLTWTRQSTYSYNYSMVAVPNAPNIIYTGSYTSVCRSDDTGRTWTSFSSGILGNTVHCVLTDPADNSTVFCGTTAGMFKSTDHGVNWQEINNGILIGKIPVVSIKPTEPHTLYIEFADNAVFKSTDDGNTWQRLPPILGCGNLCAITFDPINPLIIWLLEGSG